LVLGGIHGINGATSDTFVGIGTTVPAARLHVNGPGSDSFGVTDLLVTSAGAIGSGLTLNAVGGSGREYSLLSTNSSAGAGAGKLAVYDVTAGAYRLVVDNTGNVGIGTPAPTHKLEVNGSVAGVGPYQDISDGRYKRNIFTLTGALQKLTRLRGVSYDWRVDENPTINFNTVRQVGFIAQEVESVLPEAVTKDEKGRFRLAYSAVMPLLVEAVKELRIEKDTQVTLLQFENAALRKQNAELDVRLRNLERKMQSKTAAHKSSITGGITASKD